MFTGIVEGLGTVSALQKASQDAKLAVETPFDISEVKLGASIAVNGVCLTVTQIEGRAFLADVSYETLASTCLGALAPGHKVNVERALKASDRLDGHIVSGHVDGTGAILSRRQIGGTLAIKISAPAELLAQTVLKGSIAVDGVSLTVNELEAGSFTVSIIPHTQNLTTVGFKPPGSTVNIETDILGKYVQRFLGLTPDKAVNKSLTIESLIENGFV